MGLEESQSDEMHSSNKQNQPKKAQGRFLIKTVMGKSQVQWYPYEDAKNKNCISDEQRQRFKNQHKKYFNFKPEYNIDDTPVQP